MQKKTKTTAPKTYTTVVCKDNILSKNKVDAINV